ncbi:MAG: hypothetical protein ACYC4L_03965 [Chloroflexota bacterium]
MTVVSITVGEHRQSRQVQAGHVLLGQAILRGLVNLGIDDLAKYRIVEHFQDNPTVTMSLPSCAKGLGLHSLDRTAAVLEELCSVGVLVRAEHRNDGEVVYGLTVQREVVSRQVV